MARKQTYFVTTGFIPQAQRPSAAAASTSLTLTGIASAESFGTITRSTTASLVVAGVPSGSWDDASGSWDGSTGSWDTYGFGTPTISLGQGFSLSGIASAEAVGSFALSSGSTLNAAGITSAETTGALAISGTVSLSLTGIPNGTWDDTTGTWDGNPETWDSVGIGAVTCISNQLISLLGIGSGEVFGSYTETLSTPLLLAGIPGGEMFGRAFLHETSITPLVRTISIDRQARAWQDITQARTLITAAQIRALALERQIRQVTTDGLE